MQPDPLIIAVFASGKGSNLRAILDGVRSGRIPGARIALVISNNSAAGALTLAREHNIPALHISRRQYATDESFEEGILESLRRHDVNFIVLAGYMKKLGPRIVRPFRNRIINIHPALLPKFGGEGMYGMHVHEAVIAAGEKFSGATVHIVDDEYDRGAIIAHRTVPVVPGDTPETLAARVLEAEHALYPETLRLFAGGKIRFDGPHVIIEESR